jgi:hypothetical protein
VVCGKKVVLGMAFGCGSRGEGGGGGMGILEGCWVDDGDGCEMRDWACDVVVDNDV